ncbi:serine/threonine-protein kinase 52-like [Bidens hawaiensis]|uniref:serine/threonine-protein kinase 52-like n=1 Tax=Bidens hawaiensis TaxID=980011 RepID=UPI004049E6CB
MATFYIHTICCFNNDMQCLVTKVDTCSPPTNKEAVAGFHIGDFDYSLKLVVLSDYFLISLSVKLLDWGEEGHRSEAEIQALRAAFTQEVVVWHKLDHPNVTKFIGATMGSSDLQVQTENGQIGLPSNICCVVVEYLPGGALKSYLIKNRRKKLPFKVVIQIALDLTRGLSYLHSQKIVHRDVKTENMLLDKTRTVKIADFGVARVEASNPNDMTGETGTLGYMAPEVLNGNPYNSEETLSEPWIDYR